jgi:hypothetical protein
VKSASNGDPLLLSAISLIELDFSHSGRWSIGFQN